VSPTDATPVAWIDRVLARVARLAHRAPWRVLAATLCVLGASWFAASRLQVRGDFLDLLPERSEGARLFRHAMARMGGGSATLFVVVRSPDADANRRLVDALEPGLRALPRSLIRTVEHGPEEARRFYMARRWLFAEVGDLEEVECELSRARRRAQPGFVDLDDEPCSEHRSDRATRPAAAQSPPPVAPGVSENARPFERFRAQLSTRMREVDRYPTGYFRTTDGGIYLLVIRASGAGFGDRAGDELVARVNAIVARANPRSFHPRAEVGLGGDIANAIAERDSLLSEAALSTGTAFVLILLAIGLFFRSPWALGHIGLAMFTGVGMAYAVAYVAFGYLTMSTAFLGSIVAGNGINYAILYLARYRERRTAGDDVEAALVDASVTCRAGTQLASLAAAGAYGSLMLTGFRGFSQFGLIGASGMLFCWTGCMVIVPASVTVVERLRARLTKGGSAATSATLSTPIMGLVGTFTSRFAPLILFVGALAVGTAMWKLPAYLHDPWEYNFAKLQSSGSRQTGADAWSSEADKVFRQSAPPPPARAPGAPPADEPSGAADMILADRMDDVLAIADAVKQRDQARTHGRYVHHVETAWDVLGGPPPVMARKLEILTELRAHIDALVPHLEGRDLETAREWRPPESLRAVRPDELPSLVRERFSERDGTFGTPVFVHYRAHYSPSDGRALLIVSGLTQNVRLADGRTVPTASRATVFAEMIRSMEIDGPRATMGALSSVILVVILATRRLRASMAVLGALLAGIVLTVGGAAWLDTRLNFLNFVALPLTFGIGVEYAINLYDRMRYTHDDPSAALRSVGGAVSLCSLTTIIGYGALLVADNQALQSFGRYAMAGEVACLVTAMLLLPAALKLLRRDAPQDTH
jgi:uncharacterized protein